MGLPFSAPRLPALLIGLFLSCSANLVFAAADIPDIQRLIQQGQYAKALDEADSYIGSHPKDAQGRFLKGVILTEMNRTGEAITVFTKLSEDYPELPEPYNNLAVLYAQQKQYDKARAALEMAIRTHPSYATAHENLGDLYAKLASQAYDKALQLDSSNTVAQTKLTLLRELINKSSRPTTAKAGGTPTKVAVAEAAKPAAPSTPTTPAAAPTPAAKPAVEPAKPASPTTATAAAAKPAAGNEEAAITKALQAWAADWSRKDVKAYLGHYAGDFQPPGGLNRKAWEKERASRIDKPGKIQVDVADIHISISGDKATVRFRQSYKSASLKTSAGKTLIFIRSGGKWLIQQERVG